MRWKTTLLLFTLLATGSDQANQDSANNNRGLTAFFLRDPTDGMCLGTHGFTECNTESLWLYASRGRSKGHSLVLVLYPDFNGSCLSRLGPGVTGGPCSKRESMHWVIEGPNGNGHYRVKQTNTNAKDMCVARYKAATKKQSKELLKNSATMIPCKPTSNKSEESGYVELEVVETAVHDVGFYLKSADGYCFDGLKFRQCHADSNFLWGIGINFTKKGDLSRTLHKFHRPSSCLVEDHAGSLGLGNCESSKGQRWGLKEGKLSRDNGKICVVRKIDNAAATRPCTEAFEYFTPEIPEEAERAREASAEYRKKV